MTDPFTLHPKLWFGLLCEGLQSDDRGRLNFQAVFNQIKLFDPPPNTGVPPNAFLNCILAVGFTEGLGHFEVEIELRNVEDHTLWRRPEGSWEFDIGPGDPSGAVLAEVVRYWFTQPGRYHFLIRLSPGPVVYEIPFEVGRQIGPAEIVEQPPPGAPQ